MKRFIKLIPAALALVALASCSQDDLFSKENSQKAVNGKTMTATIENYEALTRAAFAENKNDEGKADKRALVWTTGDSYKLYGEMATPDQYTLQNASAGKSNGTFDLMTEDMNSDPAFAVFPYDAVEADRPSKKLTVTLNDWTYATATVKDEGYNQGAFKSVVPMYGQIGADGNVAFGYMTALLRVDLQKLPKKMTRLIVVTDRPLTGTFEAEFDPADKTTYPEIISPVSNDEAKENYTFDGMVYNGYYFLEIGTESVSQRTNKTFFIPVPTGNKYKTFDVLVEYNMGSLKKYERVAQLGSNDYGKVLKWERGKVKSLAKEITVTSNGNTPKELAAFLKSEWKTFPADADINITVTDPAGNFAGIDLSTTGTRTTDGHAYETADAVFEVPAEVKGRTINIIFDNSVTECFDGTGTNLTIIDEDPAPITSDPLRLINICGPTTSNTTLTLNCPETQVVLSTPAGATASYKFASLTVANDNGLVIESGVSIVSGLTITGGAVINNGTTMNIDNNGDCDLKITGTSINVQNLGTGALTIEGGAAAANITGNIINGDGTKKAGKLTIKKATLGGTVSNKLKADNGIEINDVDNLTLDDKGTGAVTITKVTTSLGNSTIDNASSLTFSDIATAGQIIYKGKGAFSADVIKGAVTEFNATQASSFSATAFEAAITDINYGGTGAVTITGKADKSPSVTNIILSNNKNNSAVAISNVKTNTKVDKDGTGSLTIVNSALGTVTNDGGEISATGGTLGKSITSLTQSGAAKVTLTGMYDVTTLNIKADANVDYENSFIGTLDVASSKKCTATGTKASGIGQQGASGGTLTPKTDVWDGSVCPTQTTGNVYTSASLAALCGAAVTNAKLFLDIDLGGTLNFQDKAATPNKGIKSVTTFDGNNKTIKNLKAETGLFANGGVTTVKNLTLDGATVTAKKQAGAIMGVASNNLTLVGVTVTKAKIGTSSDGAGNDQGIGGMIGEINGATAEITVNNGNVNNTAITGHYYLGGIIGKVTNAKKIYLYGKAGNVKDDLKGTTTTALTFNPKTQDGAWSTLLSGTIAPFIGGIVKLAREDGTAIDLQIYGTCDNVTKTLMEAWNWDKNFLTANETIKFKGCKRDDLNFIGYTSTDCPEFVYALKLVSGFEANPTMTRRNTSATTTVLDTEYNCYMAY